MNQIYIPETFDWQFYLMNNHDLWNAGLRTKDEAIKHYIEHGHNENRDIHIAAGISLVVVTKNRTENLIECLPSWLDIARITEYIIIDYSSDVPLKDDPRIKTILENGSNIKIYRVDNEEQFNLGKAYNLGVDFATNNIILKIDADYRCKNSGFLKYTPYRQMLKSFIRGDWNFHENPHLCGFCMFAKDSFVYYREDLNGWGYDDLDFYNRMIQSGLREIVFFNMDDYIEHIDHALDYGYDHKKTNNENAILCKNITPNPTRCHYTIRNNNIVYLHNRPKQYLDKIYVINLAHRTDRWIQTKDLPNVERFDAIYPPTNLFQYNLSLSPVGLESKIYFYLHEGAIGAYLSHYLLWKKILENDNEYSLILEDDIDCNSVLKFLDSNFIMDKYDFVQLSKRITYHKSSYPPCHNFHGGESYIITKKAAKAFIDATHNPALLENICPYIPEIIQDLAYQKKINNEYSWPDYSAIVAPVDKLMGYVCHPNSVFKLRTYLYPCIQLNDQTSFYSDIGLINSAHAWRLSAQQIQHYYRLLQNYYDNKNKTHIL